MTTCLGVIHYLLFNTESVELAQQNKSLLVTNALKTVDRLLDVATFSSSGDNEMASVPVQQSLTIIVSLIKAPSASQSLQSNPRVQKLLSNVFMSPSSLVRKSARDFAIEFGKSHPIVLEWLVDDFNKSKQNSIFCNEMTQAMEELLAQMFHVNRTTTTTTTTTSSSPSSSLMKDVSILKKLANIISDRLCSPSFATNTSRNMIICLFSLERLLINIDIATVESTKFGSSIFVYLFEFLFSLPERDNTEDDYSHLREDNMCRRSAFAVMLAMIKASKSSSLCLELVNDKISMIASCYQQRMRFNWNHQISHDLKTDSIIYAGLKNQGCTCYMNSLLQQMFMNIDIREAILKTPLKESHRSTLWHKSDEELVGCRYRFQWKNGVYQKGLIKAFD